MSAPQIIVLDASTFLAACLPEEPEEKHARSLFDAHVEGNIQLQAPHLLAAELLNGLYKRVRRSGISVDEIDAAWRMYQGLGIALHEVRDGSRILQLALTYRWPATYDMVYVALAEQLNATLVTADARLGGLSEHLPFVLPLQRYEG